MSQKGGYVRNERHSHLGEPHADPAGKKRKKAFRSLFAALLVAAGISALLTGQVMAAEEEDISLTPAAALELVSAKVEEALHSGHEEAESVPPGTEEAAAEADRKTEIPESTGIYNLLLVGVDRRDASWNGNSDSIILLSVDKNTETIHMISFMRDLYADIPGYGVKKLNAACAIGGCPLLVDTIEENYKVGINNYVSLDYNGMIALIDALGGVEIEVSDSEAELANGLITDMAGLRGESPDGHYFYGAGTYLADGYQATAYSRVRFTGNSDYERTERQRNVMTQILTKVKNMNAKELGKFALKVLPNLNYDIDGATMLLLIPQIPVFATYEIEQSRVPYDGLYYSDNEILMPDMEETIRLLQETVYDR